MATTRMLDPVTRNRPPRTMVADDHLTGQSATTSVVFRELSCPDFDQPGSFASMRPVVCQNGRVYADFFQAD